MHAHQIDLGLLYQRIDLTVTRQQLTNKKFNVCMHYL